MPIRWADNAGRDRHSCCSVDGGAADVERCRADERTDVETRPIVKQHRRLIVRDRVSKIGGHRSRVERLERATQCDTDGERLDRTEYVVHMPAWHIAAGTFIVG